jgi:hypothetical protein
VLVFFGSLLHNKSVFGVGVGRNPFLEVGIIINPFLEVGVCRNPFLDVGLMINPSLEIGVSRRPPLEVGCMINPFLEVCVDENALLAVGLMINPFWEVGVGRRHYKQKKRRSVFVEIMIWKKHSLTFDSFGEDRIFLVANEQVLVSLDKIIDGFVILPRTRGHRSSINFPSGRRLTHL